jgi:hypothetical protein
MVLTSPPGQYPEKQLLFLMGTLSQALILAKDKYYSIISDTFRNYCKLNKSRSFIECGN